MAFGFFGVDLVNLITTFLCIKVTNNQIEPAASLDNFLHSVLVSGGDAKPDDKDGDVVQIIAEVHEHREEPQVTIGECRSEK